jgi:hypothetical protein
MPDTRLTNPGVDDRFTCPNCYEDHTGILEDTARACDGCGVTLRFSVEQQPVAVCEIVEGEDDE